MLKNQYTNIFLFVQLLTTTSCLVGSNAHLEQLNGIGIKGNLPPISTTFQSGPGHSYQISQLGGLTFTRYGEDNPNGNQVSHDEMMDFLDDPIGNADGFRADNSIAQQQYAFSGSSTPGWEQSNSIDKYADNNMEITPVGGNDFFGDTYRGYFVPSVDGIYNFVNNILPDNGVRVMMSPNECPEGAVAIISTDFAGTRWIGRAVGAADAMSTWINGNGGMYGGVFGETDNLYLHNTTSFYPLGAADSDYTPGKVYLKAGNIYYLEIRYSEGGGGNAFSFGIDRRNIGGGAQDGVINLPATRLLPYSGSDRYVVRQACGGTFQAGALFTDPEGDTLTYSARLVHANGSSYSGAQSRISYLGLSINQSTGEVSGVVNSNYSNQYMIVTAVDLYGSNTRVDSPIIPIIR